MYCPNCGTQNSDANRFCVKCGQALDLASTVNEDKELRPRRILGLGPLQFAIVLAGVAVVVLLILVVAGPAIYDSLFGPSIGPIFSNIYSNV